MAIIPLLRLAPWRLGPRLLLRRPGVAVALGAAAFVAALPAAAAGPYLSSSRNATLHHQIAAACPYQVGTRIQAALPDGDPAAPEQAATLTRRADLTGSAAAQVPGLAPPVTTVLAGGYAKGLEEVELFLVSRTDAAKNIQVLDGPSGDGVWITDQYAEPNHLKVGDTLNLMAASGGSTSVPVPTAHPTPVRVAAIYKALRESPDQPFWCSMIPYYRPPEGNRPTPQIALLDQATLLRVAAEQNMSGVEFVEYPLADPNLSSDRAAATLAGFRRMRGQLLAAPAFAPDGYGTRITSELSDFVARAQLARNGMLPPVLPITGAGVLVGLLVLAAATGFWVQRRKRELTVLAAHGAAARELGVKAVLEALPAVFVGTALGWLGSWALVRWAGPDRVLSREALPESLLGAAGTLVVGLIVAGVVATVACRGLTDQVRARHHALPRRIPWELLLLGAAPIVWRVLGDQRQLTDQSGAGSVAHVPGRLLVVPIMVVAGLAILAGRISAGYLRKYGTRRSPSGPAAFLSWRRIGRQAAMTAVLAAATAVPIALAAYGATVTGSVRTTIADESRLHVGSDVVLSLAKRTPIPASLAGQATEVLRLDGAMVGGIQTDLLAVDPATFARDAYWDDRLDGASLADLVAPLRDGGVVAAAPTPAGAQKATWGGDPVLGGTARVTQVTVLPAELSGYPIALVDKDALGEDAQYAKVQLWVRGDPDRIQAAVRAAKLPVTRIQTAADLYANTLWEPLTYTFDYLTALSLLTGVVTVVGLLLYLESQAPLHRRAYVLLRRMGLSAGKHRRALLGELAVPLIGGLLGGLAVTAGLTVLLEPDFELNPGTPPDTVLAVPYLPLGLITGAVLVVAVGAAGYAQRRIGRANPSEVLRDAI